MKKDIEIWCELTDLAIEKPALAIHLVLTGRARVASSKLEVTELKAEEGVKHYCINQIQFSWLIKVVVNLRPFMIFRI